VKSVLFYGIIMLGGQFMDNNLQEGLGVLGVVVTVIVTVYCYHVIQDNNVLNKQVDNLQGQTTVLEQKLEDQTSERLECVNTTKTAITQLQKTLDVLSTVTNRNSMIDSNVVVAAGTYDK